MSIVSKRRNIFTTASASGGGGGGVQSVNSGTDITIDNTDPANPIVNFTGTYQDPITVVANYSALPTASTVTGEFYWCSASQGTAWLPGSLGGTYYSAGLYYSNGVTWQFMSVPYQATQAEVNTGTNTDKFVTPSTFTNASKWGNYLTTSAAASTYQPIGTYATASNSMTFTNKSGNISQWTNDSGYLTSASITGYVPYTGATLDVDLGTHILSAQSLQVTGTNGSGHINLRHQASDATATGQTTALFANSNGDLKYKNAGNYYTTFATSANTANRVYTFPNTDGTVALTSNLSSYVPTSRTITINGTAFDLSADRSWTVTSGITVGTTTITSGTSGRIPFNNSGVYDESANLFWNNSNQRLGIGTSSPSYFLDVKSPGNQSTQARFTNTTTQTSAEIYSGSGAVIYGGYSNLSATTMCEMYLASNSAYFTRSSGARIFTINDGYVAIGSNSSPTARLHLPAGTATSGTAPLKLTAGTNLTTPENGAFEFDGTNLYFTVGGVRKTVTLV